MKKYTLLTVLLASVVSIALAPSAYASGESHEHEEGAEAIPTTTTGIFDEIDEHENELSKLIAAKELGELHEVAFEIRDLVNALTKMSGGLAAEKMPKLKNNAKFVAALANRLDESGDDNDQARSEINFNKLQGILKKIRALYVDGITQ